MEGRKEVSEREEGTKAMRQADQPAVRKKHPELTCESRTWNIWRNSWGSPRQILIFTNRFKTRKAKRIIHSLLLASKWRQDGSLLQIKSISGEAFSGFVKVWYIQKCILHFKWLLIFTEEKCEEHDRILLPQKSWWQER